MMINVTSSSPLIDGCASVSISSALATLIVIIIDTFFRAINFRRPLFCPRPLETTNSITIGGSNPRIIQSHQQQHLHRKYYDSERLGHQPAHQMVMDDDVPCHLDGHWTDK